MKNIFLTALLSIIALAACNCNTANLVSKANTSGVTQSLQTDARQSKRQQDKQFLEYISARTSFIQVDCTPKEGVGEILKDLGYNDPAKMLDGWGSGIIVRSKKNASYIFTVAHVVEHSNPKIGKYFDCVYYVQRAEDAGTNNNKHIATVVVKDSKKDIAVLRVEANLGVNTVLASDTVLGEDIWAAGFPAQRLQPRAIRLSITKGVIATLKIPSSNKPSESGNFDRITAQIYFGNSGGGVWNQEGQLVAVVNAMLAVGPDDVPIEGQYFIKSIKEIITMLSKSNRYQEVFGSVD